MNDNKRKLYDALSKDYDMGTYEQFCSDIADNDKRKKLFDAASKDYDFGDYDSFSNQLGFSQEAAQQEETQAVNPVEPVAPQPIQADLNTANSPADTVRMQSPVEVAKTTVETQPEKPVEQPTPEQQRKALEASTREQVSALRSTIDDNLNAATQESIQAYRNEEEEARNGSFWKQLQYSLAHDVGHDPASIATRENLRMTKGMGNMELQGRIAALQSAQNSLKDAQRIIDEADHNAQSGTFGKWLEQSFAGGAARGLGQHLFDSRTWDMGMSDLSGNGALLVALNKFDKGEDLTESEQMMLDAKAVELATNAYFGSYVGRGYKAGSVTAEAIPFMLEMCINPASSVGKSATSKMTRYALERFGKKETAKAIEQGVKGAVVKGLKELPKKEAANIIAKRVALDAAGAAGMAATSGAIGVAADAESRMAGINNGSFSTNEEGYSFFNGYREGEDPATALAKAFGARTIENHSELVGEYFAPVLGIAGKGVSKGLEKVGLGKVNKFVKDVSMTDVGKLITDFEKHAQWHGSLGEFAEELVGGVENAIVVGDQTIDANPETGVFNPSQMLDTFLGVSLMGGFLSSAKTAGYVTSKYKSAKNLNNADAKAQAIFGDEDWVTIKDEVRNSIEDKDLTSIDARLNEEQDPVRKQAILDYLGAYVNKQGADIGTMKRRTEEDIDPVQFEAETSYDNGYELTDSQDMEDAQNMLEYRRQVLKEKTGFEDITLDQMLHPWDNQDDMPFDWTPEEKQAGIDYINAKATYEGMIQHVKDDIDSKITAAHAAIDANTNVDTKRIQPATMKTEDRKVYIVGGVAKMFEDGSGIDKENSDGSVIVKDVNTGAIEMVSPADILSLDEEIDPVDEKNAIQEQIRNTVAQEAADKIDGKVQFVPGQQYTLPDAEGNAITYQITPDPVTGKVADFTAGVVNAVIVGGPLNQDGTPVIVQIPIAPIQEQHEMESLARLEQYEQNRLVEKVSIAQNEQQSQAAERQYQQEDELSLRNADGTVVRGSIVSEPNEDGQYEVYTEEPFNGKKVNLLTKEEIENSIVLYNGNEVQKPVEEVAQETMPEQQPQAQEPVDNRPAIDRIPVNEAGEPVFEKGNAADTWQALLDMNDGNKEEAIDTANQMYETAKGELEKALKAKPKSGKTVFEIQQNKAQVKSAITAARQKADYWKSIVDFEANQKRIAEEEAKRQKRMRLAKAREILRREGRFKEENAQLGEPISFRDYVLRSISTGGITFKWGNDKNNAAIKGLGAHLGFNGQFGEMARRGWMLNKEEGLYPEQAAEDLLQGYAEELGMQDVEQTGLDTMEALNEVLDVVNSFDTPRSMFEAAKGLHGQMDFAAQEQAYIESQMQQAEEQEQEQQPESVVKNPLTTEQEAVSREDLVADVADMIQQSDGDMRLLDYLDDDELKQFSDLYNKFITVNETFGDMSMRLADALHSKDKKVAAEAKAQIDAAQQAAVDAFNPIMDLYGGLLKKYNLSDEEDLPSDTDVNTPAAEIEQARQEVNVEPTEGQKQAGNYKMGHIKLDGYDISLENPKGSIRKGVDESGKEWQSEMHNDYGYLRGTQGVDGDHIDVFLSDTPEQGNVYVVDQVNPKTGEFDEHKVMYGFNSVEEAQAAYLSNYEEGWQGLGNITPVSKEEFKKWIDSSHRKTKPFAEYANVKPLQSETPSTPEEEAKKTVAESKGDQKYQSDQKIAEEEYAESLEVQGYLSAAPKKLSKVDIAKYAQKAKDDNLRTALNGVFHDKGLEVATDSHILVSRKATYDKSLEGKSILNGKEINAPFPAWRDLFKQESTPESIDFERLSGFIQAAKADERYTKGIKEGMRIGIRLANGEVSYYKANLLEKFVEFARSIEGKPMSSKIGKVYGASRLEAINGEQVALLMPTKLEGKGLPGYNCIIFPTAEEEAAAKARELNNAVSEMTAQVTGKPLEEVQQSGDYKVGDTFSNETGLTGTVDAIAPNGDIRLNLTQKIQFGPDGHTQRWFKPEEFANYAEHNGMKPLQDVAVSEEEPVVKQVDVEGLFNALKTKGEAKLSDFAKEPETVPQTEESVPEKAETVPESTESVSKQPLGTIRTGKHTKTGEDLWIVTPTDRVSKEEFSQLKAAAKERDGYYSSFKPNNGFIFKTEEDAKAFNEENSREPSEPVSLDTMKSVVGGSFDTVEAKQEDTKENKPARKWQYELYVSNEGYSRITRSDMSNPYGIEDEFEITADNPEDLKGILENNGMTEILDSIGDKLHNRIVLWQVHQQAQNEGFHGYKIGDKIIYTSGNKEYPGVVTDFEEYGEHLPVVDTGMAPVMYEVAHLDQIRHAEEPAEKVEQPANPSGNKLVTDERYAELKRRMLDKLKGQMNMGIDPEILAIGTEMAVYHIEKGARKFVDYAKSMIEDLGDVIRPYLKAFYNGARDLPEMGDLAKEMTPYDEVSSIDTANFDKATTDVFAAAETIAKEQEVEEQADEAKERIKTSTKPLNNKKKTVPSRSESVSDEEKAARRAFSSAVATDMINALDSGERPYKSIVQLRERARRAGMQVDDEGRDDILIQELVEDGLVKAARFVVEQELHGASKSRECYDAICKLYEMQPTIAARSSNRIKMQQYSTPLPMGFVADMFAYYKGKTHTVLEPTAGNGMLVFAVPAQAVHANELDKTRLENLMLQGFGLVTSQDATLPIRDGHRIYDAVIANPPFGAAEAKVYDGKEISGLDPQITLNALSNMKDDGKAAIIIGGNLEYGPNGAIKGKKSFITYLYDHYNVKGIVDMEGQLYQRQGTTYPTMMILIDGRRTEEERAQTAVYPPVKANAVRKAETFDDLYDIVTEIISSTDKTNGTEILRSQQGQLLSDIDNAPRNDDGTRHTEKPRKDGKSGRGQRTASDGTLDLFGESGQDNGVSQSGNGPDTGRGSEKPVGGLGGNAAAPVAGNIPSENGVGLKAESKPETKPQEKPVQAPVRKEQKPQEKRDLNTEKLPYRPHNTAFSLESVAPAAMVEAMDRTLSAIEEEHGSIDEFVRSELGYDTIDDAHNALAAEQMDAVAMAIVQMKKGEALIIGDQTGVGKGRQMASLIRWAVRQGQKPIFITQKADLFSDLYRDMVDVGIGDLRPFIFNSDGAIVDQNKKDKDGKPLVIHKPASSSEQAKVFASGQLPDEYDFAVLTYSQVNTGDAISQQEAEAVAKENAKETGSSSFGSKKSKSVKNAKPTPKATFLRALAEDNYLLLDESHTAAGSSNTGMYLQSILKTARAATFASATFAKRPDTMPLYAIRTAMSKAKVKINELITIIEKGGVTLQEIMSRALTEAGQMVRRERDMSDVVTDWKTITDPATVQRARENYDKTIEAFNDIIKFQQDYVKPRIYDLSASLAVTASSANVKKGTDKMGVENVPFASKTNNYTKQLMLALKVDAIADEVEAQIKAGLHPVIALESTMESSIKDYSPGAVIPEPTFSASLLKGLDSCMQYTDKDEDGKEQHYKYSPAQLGPDAEQAYYELRDKIREATSDIFISPLDAIISKLEAKGYKVGELTGRNSVVEIDDKGRAVVKKRTDKDKKLMQAQFNDGTLDVLILNKSASTGISLHASKKFKDQRQRAMIIAQPLSDINDYMQMSGRIDRTGQVARGYYINLVLPIPAEQRFLMMLATKLKSLNANTTTAQESESNSVDAPDLLNKYGSQVVIEYLRDNPEIYTKMGEPLKTIKGNVHASELDEYKPTEDDARLITGYVALLKTEEQEAFYNDVVDRYTELINYLNDIGENDLKIRVMPLRAETLSRKVSSEGMDPNGDNPFAQHAFVEEVEMDVLREPMKADEIRKLIESLSPAMSDEEKGKPFRERVARLNALKVRIQESTQAKLDAENVRYEKEKARMADDVARNTERINKNEKLSPEDKERAIQSYINDLTDKIETKHADNIEKINNAERSFIRRIGMFHIGETYLIPDQLETPSIAFCTQGIFCGFKTGDKKITPSTTTAIFATMDGRRKVEVKLSQIGPLNNIEQATMSNFAQAQEITLDNWDSQKPTERRKKGFIMTGNILQAIADTKDKNGNYQGQLISFTDIDGNVRDGILMPDKWNPTQLTTSGVPILARLQEIRSGRLVTSIDNAVTIQGGYQNIFYTLRVPKTKAAGGFIFQNDEIVNLTNGGSGFYQSRGQLQADIPSDNIDELVRLLSNLGVKVDGKNEAKQDANRYRSAYHGTGADFDEFDLTHAGEGEGNLAHGYGVYATFSKDTATGYAWNIAFDDAERQGLLERRITEIVRNDAFDTYEEMVKRYDALLESFQKAAADELAQAKEEGNADDIRFFQRDYDDMMSYRPLSEILEDRRNLYTIEIPEDNGHNYIAEMKTLPKEDRRRLAEHLRTLSDELLQREKHGPNWLPDGWRTLANVIEREQYAGLEIRERLVDALGSEAKASEVLSDAGFVGYTYNGRADGECAVIFNTSDIDITNHERFRIREKEAPVKSGTGYKVFVLKNGRLYPPMVNNAGGVDTPVFLWLDAEAAPIAGQSKTGRNKVKSGGGTLAYRPGWHLGKIPYALQFNRGEKVDNPLGVRSIKGDLVKVGKYFPKNFVWAEVEYAADKNYQKEAMSYGYNENGKFQHSLAGLPAIPEDGYYEYRTNANPATDPWIITGAMRVKKILTPSEVDALVEAAGRKPQLREEGAYSDAQIEQLNESLSKLNEDSADSKIETAMSLAESLGVKVNVIEDRDQITDKNRTRQRRKRNSKGWYDTISQEIVVVIPNNVNNADVEATILHEIVGHKGMRELVGDENYNDFLEKVYRSADPELRKKITELAARKGWDFNLATEEYIASLAENGFNDRLERNLFEKIRDLFVDMLRRAKIALGHNINDNDLRYMLWRAYKGRIKSALDLAEDINARMNMQVGDYAESNNNVNFVSNERRGNQTNDNDRTERNDGTGLAENNARRLGAKHTLGDTGVFEEELAAQRSRYSEADGTNYIEGQISESLIDAAKREGKFIPWEEATSAGIRLHGNTKESICLVSEDQSKITKLKDPFAARATKGNTPFDIIEELIVHNELFPETAYRLVGITQDRLGDMRFVLEQDYIQYQSFADENDIAEHLQSLGLKDEGRFIFGDERCAVLDAYGENVLVDENGNLRFIDPIIRIKQSPDGDIRYRSGEARDLYEQAERRTNKEGQKTSTANLFHRLHEAYQDSMLALKELQKAISKETGNRIEDNENAYIAENAMSSQNKAQADIYRQKFYNPLLDALKALMKQGAKYNDIVSYAIAKHGLERNEYMARKKAAEDMADKWKEFKEKYSGVGPETTDNNLLTAMESERAKLEEREEKLYAKYSKMDFSGLKGITGDEDNFTAIAEMMVEDFEKKYDTKELWDKVNKATKETLYKNYASGLMSRETYNTVKGMFDYYIPLRGWDSNVAANEYDYLLSSKPLFSQTLKTMRGRTSVADDPFATIGHIAESAIALGNRNLMKQKFLNFVLNNPTSLATVSKQWYVKDPATGEWEPRNPYIPEDATPDEITNIIEQFEQDMRELELSGNAKTERRGLNLSKHATVYEGQEHVVRVKRNGVEYAIYINGNPRAAQALNGLTNPNASESKLLQKAQAIKNFMARMFTSQNPAFIITNLSRDTIWSGTAVAIKENARYNEQYQRNIIAALTKGKLIKLVSKFNNGKLDDSVPIEKYFTEFIKNGGETGFTQLNTVEDFKRDMRRFVKDIEKGGTPVPTKVWRSIWDGIEFMNRCAEDTTRFAVYMTSRQMGRSVSRSVFDAKEITVNFNKKGSGGYLSQFMNFAYIFFNATVQSIANITKLAKEHPGKMSATVGLYTAAGILTPLLALCVGAAFGGGDDDDEETYWDLPEWIRRNNLVFRIPWSTNGYITIPLPHELRPFYGIGEIAFSCIMGKEKVEDGMKKGAEGFSSMIPLDFTGNAGNTAVNFTPTIAQPFAQLIANVDFFGTPIYKRNGYNELDPEWTKAYKGTNAWVVNGTKWLNDVTGGDNVKKGVIDLNPAVIEHLYESYFGGVGKTINRAAKTVSMVWDEDMREWRNVPVASSFIQKADERTSGSQLNREYYNYKEEHDKVEHELAGYKKQLRMGAMEYAEVLNDFIESEEFQRYRKLHGYIEAVQKMNTALKYTDELKREELEENIKNLKKTLVEELHNEKDSNK